MENHGTHGDFMGFHQEKMVSSWNFVNNNGESDLMGIE